MKDEYTSAFYDIVKEASETTGYQLPIEIESYVVMLLADKIDKPNFLPEQTFAEELLALKQPYKLTAKELGDTCLFVTGVFPEYGISIEYYSNIGKSSYSIATTNLHTELFDSLSTNFDFIRKFINLSIKPNNLPIYTIR
jgi:hypothetical protein